MTVYRIFEPALGRSDEPVFVKEGYSWSAMTFSILWALRYRMWIVAILLLAGFVIVGVVGAQLGIGEGVRAVVNFGMAVLMGFEAETLRSWTLTRAGYRESGVVAARSLEEAELKFAFATPQVPHVEAESATRRPVLQTHDPLGLFGAA